ncbi:low molecular weight protein arginine phosphatase [Staphylococcus simiae]|uniref:low molecular weight protein arginine phosphatase n=1 Tax=Staphylococcus simiae TaxID=308354 RepID=UPI001A9678FB|nr:low molecular weight protein arginine phosphatase [Staphylococcus simiae]MBO1199175.1 low molecular weight protein arginine phosphatase [Staphylococcus simiae]MBO1201376.1 low molecular weight protein arginine phosphatase [Staphylococcus simiae]MBO1203524.1 low molecular weight protein arginine phosphatase [Staphylococcus simiae]MBO1211052.1 low molecular weight protein arginine phosphatase [Staphylococcus simiae]MBO1229668.1 low molecular weight protein arginine phosphatase [Staphylococcus
MKIIFVCTGNTCRSPLAESMAQTTIPEHQFESRGIFASNGQSVSMYVAQIIAEHHLPKATRSQQFTIADLDADLILTMSSHHKETIKHQYGNHEHVYTLSEFVNNDYEVHDPFGGDEQTYKETYLQLESLIKDLKEKLTNMNSV